MFGNASLIEKKPVACKIETRVLKKLNQLF